MNDWDEELQLVAQEVASLREQHQRKRAAGMKPLVAKKVALVQAQLDLDSLFARIKRLATRENYTLLPREKTMLHFGKRLAERAEKLEQHAAKHRAKALWLDLIKSRLDGDADELVALAVRQANLVKTEKYLEDTLNKIRVRKKDLTKRYDQLGVAETNRVAGASLGARLGATPEKAMMSPHVRAIAELLRMTTAAVARPEAEERLRAADTRFGVKATGLLGICRSMVLSRLRDGGVRPSARAAGKFELALQQLDDLEAETRRAFDEMLSAKDPEIG